MAVAAGSDRSITIHFKIEHLAAAPSLNLPEPRRCQPARPVRFDFRLGVLEVWRGAVLLKVGRPFRRLERPMPDDRLSCRHRERSLVESSDDDLAAHDGELRGAGALVSEFESHALVVLHHLPKLSVEVPGACFIDVRNAAFGQTHGECAH